jgi:CO/xanthine dehydrogenase Mo-binding subunit
MERTIDRIAEHLGLDRTDVRARNLIQPDEFPYDFDMTFQDGRPLIYDSGEYPASLERLKQMIGWDAFAAEQAAARGEGRRLGIGLACYVEGTGVGPYEGGHVHVETNGRVMVATGLTSQGQGHETVFAQIVADELGVDVADVHVTTGDTRRFPYAVGTYASRAAVMSGNAVALAARAVRAKAIRIAAEALEAAPADLDIVGGVVQVRGTPARGIPLSQVAVLSNPLRYSFSKEAQAATQFATPADPDVAPVPEDDEPGLEARDYYSPVRSTFASGMHAAVVEVDAATGAVDVVRYAVVHDCGPLINPMIVEGQIQGGVAQGVAGALLERLAYDEAGNLCNASFMDFLMPYLSEVPVPDIDHLETPSPLNPLGIKGAGEAGVIPVSACLAAAIEDAAGVPVDHMPISPPELWAKLGSRGTDLGSGSGTAEATA